MLDAKEIEAEIARLEYMESSYSNYAKLADLYTIQNQMKQGETDDKDYYEPQYFVHPSAETVIGDYGDSEFLQAITGKDTESVCGIMDYLMDTLRVVNTKAYDRIMRKIDEI